jgi:hypothetical protein
MKQVSRFTKQATHYVIGRVGWDGLNPRFPQWSRCYPLFMLSELVLWSEDELMTWEVWPRYSAINRELRSTCQAVFSVG